ncbi:protein of unknown function (plasmid) [Cupriavidus taiwanensis]|uniref:Uncharacterized protein n=1 Tax=Cupriavidus taiwanensis TaxID=164546 RepID=A0A375IJL5_9BURK|nr:protein of unknown function [Cupriavidus taiwanensis]
MSCAAVVSDVFGVAAGARSAGAECRESLTMFLLWI